MQPYQAIEAVKRSEVAIWSCAALLAALVARLHWSLCLLVAPLAAVQVLWLLFHRRFFALGNSIPGPSTFPFVGNFFTIVTYQFDLIPMLLAFKKIYGLTFRFWLGPQAFVVISHPKDLETIMSSPRYTTKSKEYEDFVPWLGTGLLTSSGAKWQQRRKIITPTFHFRILERFVDNFNYNARVLQNCLEKEVDRGNFDIHSYTSLCTLDIIICECAMGTKISAQLELESSYVKAVQSMCWLIFYRGLRPWLRIPFIFNNTSIGRTFKKTIETLHGLSTGIIHNRKQEYMAEQILSRERTGDTGVPAEDMLNVPNSDAISARCESSANTSDSDEENIYYATKMRYAFLDHLIRVSAQGKPYLSEEDIREEVDTIMFQAHDTTSTAISFTLFCLATNQHIQDKLYEEIFSIFGESDRDATFQDLSDMKYMECVIKESLRLYPSVPVVWRVALEEIPLPSGRTIPIGATIAINIFSQGRNDEVFKDPEVFEPDRFLPENCQRMSPFDLTPFSAGPRNCVGQKFAMLAMKVILSRVLRSYSLLPPPHSFCLQLCIEVLLKSRTGIKIRISPRSNRSSNGVSLVGTGKPVLSRNALSI